MGLSAPIVNDSDLWAAGPDAAFGTYPKLWNYTGPHLSKRSSEFADAYKKKFGAPPEVEGWQDWFGTTAILTAIKETKSTDTAKLVAFWRSTSSTATRMRRSAFGISIISWCSHCLWRR